MCRFVVSTCLVCITWFSRPGLSGELWAVRQQCSGLASVIVLCQWGMPALFFLLRCSSLGAHRRFWHCIQNQVRAAFQRPEGQASLGMFFKIVQAKIEHANRGHMGASGHFAQFVKLILDKSHKENLQESLRVLQQTMVYPRPTLTKCLMHESLRWARIHI